MSHEYLTRSSRNADFKISPLDLAVRVNSTGRIAGGDEMRRSDRYVFKTIWQIKPSSADLGVKLGETAHDVLNFYYADEGKYYSAALNQWIARPYDVTVVYSDPDEVRQFHNEKQCPDGTLKAMGVVDLYSDPATAADIITRISRENRELTFGYNPTVMYRGGANFPRSLGFLLK
jgi:hypothetical protein